MTATTETEKADRPQTVKVTLSLHPDIKARMVAQANANPIAAGNESTYIRLLILKDRQAKAAA